MSKTKTKREAEIKHCLRRLSERFQSGDETYDEILSAIREGRAEFVYRQSNTRTIFKVDDMYAVYNKLRKTVITVLTQEMLR